MAVPGNQGKTLHIAAMDGDTAAIQRWLDAGFFVDKRDTSERTGLHQAAWSGRTEVSRLLLGAYADVDARDNENRTPLHFCSETGYTATIKEMLSFKADINAVDVKRETPLSKAARAGMVDAVAALLTAGANIEVRDVEGRFAGESFSHKAPMEARDEILAMINSRRKDIAEAQERQQELRTEQHTKHGPRVKERKDGITCVCCSIC